MGQLELTGRVKMDNNFEYIFSHFSSVDGKKKYISTIKLKQKQTTTTTTTTIIQSLSSV